MRFIIIAAEVPYGWEMEDVIQGTMEAVGDIEESELTIVNEVEVPSSAYRITWERRDLSDYDD